MNLLVVGGGAGVIVYAIFGVAWGVGRVVVWFSDRRTERLAR